jgi:hypothetical protein
MSAHIIGYFEMGQYRTGMKTMPEHVKNYALNFLYKKDKEWRDFWEVQ